MRTICDACESAPAVLFCAADEAALCSSCDDKVHKCNKLANRHVRVRFANPSKVPRCDICENSPGFFYCEVDGTSLCLQCDMIVHVGGKRTHGRYLSLRQRVEFPGDKSSITDDVSIEPKDLTDNPRDQPPISDPTSRAQTLNNHRIPVDLALDANAANCLHNETKMIDLNRRPARTNGQASTTQTLEADGNNHGSSSVFRMCNFENGSK